MDRQLEERLAKLEQVLEAGTTQQSSGSPAGKHRPKWPVVVAVTLTIIAVTLGALWLLRGSRAQSDADTRTVVSALQQQTNLPLYYPADLPPGYSIDPASVQVQSALVTYQLTRSDNSRLIVTEQARPPIMEDVKKISEFKSKSGPTYIADVGGQQTGFIVADKTLIIISNTRQSEAAQLRDILAGFEKL